jgi:hypothetical protein
MVCLKKEELLLPLTEGALPQIRKELETRGAIE